MRYAGGIGILVVVALLFAASAAGGTYPGADGAIAFSEPEGGDQIVAVSPSGKSENFLTGAWDGQSTDPSYSADGGSIVFAYRPAGSKTHDVYVMNSRAEHVKPVTDTPDVDESNPTYSPDGSTIAFDAGGDLFTIGVDGAEQKQLTSGKAQDSAPEYSPDGKTLIFQGGPKQELSAGTDVYSLPASGGRAKDLTASYRGADTRQVGFLAPSFSPDGKQIVLNSNLDAATRAHARRGAGAGDIYNDQLYLMRANGKGLDLLTTSGKTEAYGGTFSPDGDRIAFVGDTTRGSRHDGVYVINADGSGQKLIYQHASPSSVSWQPRP